jgi:hypothetical protein
MTRLLAILLLLHALCFAKSTNAFEAKIHRHKSASNRILVDKLGSLTFDDANRKLIFGDGAHDDFEVAYDTVAKVVFDVNTHMRGGVVSQVVSSFGIPGVVAGGAIAGTRIHNYWFYLEYSNGKKTEQILLEVPKQLSKQVIDKSTSVFGSKVLITDFHETAEPIDPAKLADIKSKDTVRIEKQNHPLPESRTDKAIVVVVCPPLAARYAGRGNQFKLHANDHVVAVNKPGTYSFAYLEPGKYRLVTQSENADGFEMQLEAGQTYYFVQNTLQGAFKYGTLLSRNSQELVMYLVDGSYFSDWKRK